MQREPELLGQTAVVMGGSAGIGLGLVPTATAALPALTASLALEPRTDPGQPHRRRLRRHTLSASLLRDELEKGQQLVAR
jgi:hypothetical protein